jgi:hypothetical protein
MDTSQIAVTPEDDLRALLERLPDLGPYPELAALLDGLLAAGSESDGFSEADR